MTEGTAPIQNQTENQTENKTENKTEFNTQGSNDATQASDAPQADAPQESNAPQASGEKQQSTSGELTFDNLPQDVKDALPEDAQRLYIAAFNSFFENSNDREAATRVAWQTIEHNDSYERDASGKWQRLPEPTAVNTTINETSS